MTINGREEKFGVFNGVKSRYFLSGDSQARPIILLHGWGCEAATLVSIENVASESCFTVNVDFPGFGQSAEPSTAWGVKDYVKWLRELVLALNIDSPILLGHSFGGRVSILYASEFPVNKLILVDSAGVKPKRELKYYFKVYSFKLVKFFANIFMSPERARLFIDAQRKKRGSNDYANSSNMMRAIMSKVVNEDLCYAMPAIKAPTLLIWGENDSATPLRDAKKMEKLISGSGLVVFPGCSHYSFLDNPRQFAAVLRSFLNS